MRYAEIEVRASFVELTATFHIEIPDDIDDEATTQWAEDKAYEEAQDLHLSEWSIYSMDRDYIEPLTLYDNDIMGERDNESVDDVA